MILYTKSNCVTCQLVKEYLDSINVDYEIINIDTKIPASLMEQMSRPDFPEMFRHPILVDNNKLYFGTDILTRGFN